MSVRADLVERRNSLDAKRKKLKSVFDEAGPDLDMDKITLLEGDSAGKAAGIKTMNDEITALSIEVDGLASTVLSSEKFSDDEKRREERRQLLEHPSDLGDLAKLFKHGDAPQKSFGELFIESEGFKGFKGGTGPTATLDINLKTVMSALTAGWTPESTRGPRVVDFVTRPVQVTDTIPSTTTSQNAIKYMEETTFTSNAVETAEAGTYGEAALALTQRTDLVEKIPVWLPVTDEQLEDVPQVMGYINNRLPFMIAQRLDRQILIGDGTAPNLSGILDRSGLQTQAKGADPVPDAVYKAMTKVRLSGSGNGGAIPNVCYMHPNDWQDVRLLRTADGIYIWGSPSEVGIERIWGLPVVLAEALTEGTGIVGDTTFAEVAIRKGIDVQISNSHASHFIIGIQAIRADMRVAFVVYRPAAFCSVTGI